MTETPRWRQGYDAVERSMEPWLKAALDDDRFAQAVGVAFKVQQESQKVAASSTRRLLHAVNLPAGTDVTRILNELGALKRQVHELSTDLERLAAATAADPTPHLTADDQPPPHAPRPRQARR